MHLNSRENLKSLWADKALPAPQTEVLHNDIDVDVIVIGAGYTGISSALHLAKAGKKVAVLEAREIGHGGSGTNNGMLIPALVSAYPNGLKKHFGAERGERFAALVAGCASEAFNVIRKFNIDCNAVQGGWVQPAHSPGRAKLAHARFEEWQSVGAHVSYLDKKEITDLTGSPLYHGGWLASDGGHVNPLSLIRGLAGVAIAHKVQIHTQSAAISVKEQGSHWIVSTKNAKARANQIIVATDAYTEDLFPQFSRSFVPVNSWQLATKPLPEKTIRSILKNNVALSDSHGDLHFAHLTEDNRLISGGKLFFEHQMEKRMKAYTAKRIHKMFPTIDPEVQFDYLWNGTVGITVDSIPRLHQLAPGMIGVIGYSGRGVALGISMGRILAEATLGKCDIADLALPLTPIKPLPIHGLVKRVARLKLLYFRWKDSQEVRV